MAFNWNHAPGSSPADRRRKTARKILGSLIVGMLSISVVWAGTGLVPVADLQQASEGATQGGNAFIGLEENGDGEAAAAAELAPLKDGQVYAGAHKISMYPRPEDYTDQFPGAYWEKDDAQCETVSENAPNGFVHADDVRVRWHENPNCLYMGGYGIGPMNAITKWDMAPEDDQNTSDNEKPNGYGLWVRSIAMQDAAGDAVVLTLLDAVYWEAHYDSLCAGEPSTPAGRGDQDCGFIELSERLSAETGLPPSSFIFASTHSHTAPDFIGGWGAVPEWYMAQIEDSLLEAPKTALARMEPAVLETGESIMRERNGERRDFYHSAEDDTFSWFRLIDADSETSEVCTTPSPSPTPTKGPKRPHATPSPAPSPSCTPGTPARAIATVGAYAAHPVTEDEGGGEGDADFPAVFAKAVEKKFGTEASPGVGMFLQTGLGNMSPRGNKVEMGQGMASYVPPVKQGQQVTNPDVKVGRTFWDHPVTNVPLGHLGAAGIFDRTFNKSPASVNVGDTSSEVGKCKSASHVSVNTSVSAAKIGSLWITGGPGEVFSNFTNTVEERNPGGVTMALGLVNDGLGYVVESFETDNVARQGVGFVAGEAPDQITPSEYEDAYSIDHCFGDAAMHHTLQLLGSI